MPERDYVWLPREDILQFEEIDRLVDMFLDLGVRKVRLTGGEPLLRKDLPVLVERLAAKPRLEDLALTTNGVLLAPMAAALKQAGLHRLTVSLDTLQRDRFVKLARYDELDRVLEGIDAAAPLFPGFKIDTVVIRGVNDDELVPMVEFAKARGAEVRFIEYMDVGGATQLELGSGRDAAPRCWRASRAHYGAIAAVDEAVVGAGGSLPAARRHGVRHHLVDDRTVLPELRSQPADRRRHVVSVPLCGARHSICERRCGPAPPTRRSRALHLRDVEARAAIAAPKRAWRLRDRSPLIPLGSLKRDPHLEMHTRGG